MRNKKILVGVTGGIAAYKAVELVRLLRKAGCEVQVIMTESAKQFITPLTLQAVSANPVRDNLFDLAAESGMGHIELARWAELIVIAPASANFIAKLRQGLAEDLLTTVCLATRAPIVLAPAMNSVMWQNPAVQQNVHALRARSVTMLGPASGEQACGEVGVGRMLEPQDIFNSISNFCKQSLLGQEIMITAGPTRELLDPVRYFSNCSTGVMGYALAEVAQQLGAQVTLISGPVALSPPVGVKFHAVTSAEQMNQVVQDNLKGIDIFIGAAAVADYKPQAMSLKKLKKQDTMTVKMTLNPDIVATVAASLQRPRLVVGFAAETHELMHFAKQKLIKKNLDLIIANAVGVDQGFGEVENEVFVLFKEGQVQKFPKTTKLNLSKSILNLIAERCCQDAALTQ